ncbi:2Fe-2S iron-sulfur cluster binding domain-containing protein [Methylocystis sp. IM3]|uniref:2Fe-2S iron-sulfur cluster binding domain-containing protein n=1 Tax=unclassified Methylocystis TaxID=2625913 RepID=UPI0030F57C58
MTLLTYREAAIEIEPGEDVLSALLRAEIDAPHSCRSGVCQSCLHRVVEGSPPAAAQKGLSDAQKALGYFLPCVCVPDAPLTIVPAQETGTRSEAVVHSMDRLSGDVVRLRLEHDSNFAYRPGQFLELITDDGLGRHYSIASVPEEDAFIELHIRLHPGGRMSRFISDELAHGRRLHIAGPLGTCIYEGVDADQPMALIGSGTGLAPLIGVLRDALRRGHRGPIRLYHGARERNGLYLHRHLKELTERHANLNYVPRVLSDPDRHGGDVAAAALEHENELSQTAFFLCGGERLVGRLKRDLYMKGASLKQMRSDTFLPARSGR